MSNFVSCSIAEYRRVRLRTIEIGAHGAPGMNAQSCAEVRGRLAALLLGVLLLFFASQVLATEADRIAVVSPEIGEPFRGIFTQIIEGIEDKLGIRVPNHQVRTDTDIDVLRASMRRRDTKVVIALGRQGMKTASALNDNIRVVVGGVLAVPADEAREQPVVSLSPDPALLFARMKVLMPAAKRVFVVYDPAFNDWLIKLANEAAREHGLELVAHEVRDLRSAVQFYQGIFSAADSHSDVLWLPQDPTSVEESSVLPLVLQKSWNQNLAVFSSNVGHVRRGVLFSLYPDNVALGKSLGGLAQGILATGDYGKRGMMPLRDVQAAVNMRTAQHLGLNMSRQIKNFESVFPEP